MDVVFAIADSRSKSYCTASKKEYNNKKIKNNSGGNSGDGGNGMVVGSQFLFKLFNTLYLNVTKRNVA